MAALAAWTPVRKKFKDEYAEDEATIESPGQTLIEVPSKIVPRVRQLIAEHDAHEKSS